jgi:predicted dehydrogenase
MTDTSRPARIAVIGSGFIGHRHIEYIHEEPRCRLAAVVDPDPQTAKLEGRAGAPYYSNIDVFLQEGDADAAIIATPNQTHANLAIACIEKGLHVLVEKPIDSLPFEADRVVRAAEDSGVRILVGHHRRFNSYTAAAKAVIEKELLGRISGVNVLWTNLKPAAYFEAEWRKESGGGPVLINLIHDIDNLRYLFGDIERVYAEYGSGIRGFSVEDTAAATIRFKNGILASVLISDATASPYNFESGTGENPQLYSAGQDCYRIFGTEGSLSFPDMTHWKYEGENGWTHPLSSNRIDVKPVIPMKEQLRHFCDIIQNGAQPRCSGRDGIETLKAAIAIGESARSGTPVTLE